MGAERESSGASAEGSLLPLSRRNVNQTRVTCVDFLPPCVAQGNHSGRVTCLFQKLVISVIKVDWLGARFRKKFHVVERGSKETRGPVGAVS